MLHDEVIWKAVTFKKKPSQSLYGKIQLVPPGLDQMSSAWVQFFINLFVLMTKRKKQESRNTILFLI